MLFDTQHLSVSKIGTNRVLGVVVVSAQILETLFKNRLTLVFYRNKRMETTTYLVFYLEDISLSGYISNEKEMFLQL